MEPGPTLRTARRRAGLTQKALADLTGTSQATISAYESGNKQPSVETFSRLLEASGSRLAIEELRTPLTRPSRAQLRRTGRSLVEVLDLAESLPVRHEPVLRYPRLA